MEGDGMDEATRERNHQIIMRDLGRIEGRVDALERRMDTIDDHLEGINKKLDRLFETLNQRIGRDTGTSNFWAVLITILSLGVAGAALLIDFQADKNALKEIIRDELQTFQGEP